MTLELSILIAILLPLLAAGGILLSGRNPNLREAITILASLAVVMPHTLIRNSGLCWLIPISSCIAGGLASLLNQSLRVT